MKFGYFTLSDNHYANNTRTTDHAQVKDEMARFAAEVAPHFAIAR